MRRLVLQTYQSRLAVEAKKLMQQSVTDLSNTIAAGALSSFDEYKYHTGRIAGLRDAIDFIDEAIAVLDGKERS